MDHMAILSRAAAAIRRDAPSQELANVPASAKAILASRDGGDSELLEFFSAATTSVFSRGTTGTDNAAQTRLRTSARNWSLRMPSALIQKRFRLADELLRNDAPTGSKRQLQLIECARMLFPSPSNTVKPESTASSVTCADIKSGCIGGPILQAVPPTVRLGLSRSIMAAVYGTATDLETPSTGERAPRLVAPSAPARPEDCTRAADFAAWAAARCCPEEVPAGMSQAWLPLCRALCLLRARAGAAKSPVGERAGGMTGVLASGGAAGAPDDTSRQTPLLALEDAAQAGVGGWVARWAGALRAQAGALRAQSQSPGRTASRRRLTRVAAEQASRICCAVQLGLQEGGAAGGGGGGQEGGTAAKAGGSPPLSEDRGAQGRYLHRYLVVHRMVVHAMLGLDCLGASLSRGGAEDEGEEGGDLDGGWGDTGAWPQQEETSEAPCPCCLCEWARSPSPSGPDLSRGLLRARGT